jgi:hypothetical protein
LDVITNFPAGLVVVEKLMERRCPRISFGICAGSVAVRRYDSRKAEDKPIAWKTPVLVEICIGLEINGYPPAAPEPLLVFVLANRESRLASPRGIKNLGPC